MPLYTITTQAGVLDAVAKAELADNITASLRVRRGIAILSARRGGR